MPKSIRSAYTCRAALLRPLRPSTVATVSKNVAPQPTTQRSAAQHKHPTIASLNRPQASPTPPKEVKREKFRAAQPPFHRPSRQQTFADRRGEGSSDPSWTRLSMGLANVGATNQSAGPKQPRLRPRDVGPRPVGCLAAGYANTR